MQRDKKQAPKAEEILPTLIPSILVLVSPLGVAGQNIGLALAIALFCVFCFLNRGAQLQAAMKSQMIRPFGILWLMIVVPIVVATLARGDYKEASKFFLGYSLLLPMIIMGLTLCKTNLDRKTILTIMTVVTAILGLVSLSQFLIGWKIEGSELTTQIKRAQGFYSHPLTLAYATLAVMPLIVCRLFSSPSDWRSIAMGLAVFCIVICSQSITVIVLTAVVVGIVAIRLLNLKKILVTAMAAALFGTALIGTQNPVAEKFHQVLQGQRGDHETPYPDDRMAFWHAHWEMFKDAPILGHGSGITRELREPYYTKIGLGHIKRMYEAHNMFLQLAVEGGVFAALGFLVFLIWWFFLAKQAHELEPWKRLGYMITPVAFALGGMTQNALQDSEVRYMLFFMFSLTISSISLSQKSTRRRDT